MGASPGCCQVRQKGFKDYLQAHGRVKLQTTLAIYNHHRESFFFFFFFYRLGPGGGCYDILQDKRGMKKNQRGPLQHLSLS